MRSPWLGGGWLVTRIRTARWLRLMVWWDWPGAISIPWPAWRVKSWCSISRVSSPSRTKKNWRARAWWWRVSLVPGGHQLFDDVELWGADEVPAIAVVAPGVVLGVGGGDGFGRHKNRV